MSKSPAFQFYPGDWMKDPAVRSCSLAARGLWTDMLCLMFESPRRGYLQHATGKPVTADQLARMTGCSTDEVSRLLRELEDAGVFSRTLAQATGEGEVRSGTGDGSQDPSSHGVIYSRRMARDERKRQLCSEAGKKGGSPILKDRLKDSTLKGLSKGAPRVGVKGRLKPNPTPSSSSSASAEEKKEVAAQLPSGDEETLKGRSGSGPRPTRQRDDLFDAIAEVTGSSPGASGSHIGRVKRELLKENPPFTPAEVRLLPAVWKSQGMTTPVTLGTVEKYIGWVRSRPGGSGNGGQDVEEAALANYRRRTLETAEDYRTIFPDMTDEQIHNALGSDAHD